MKKKQQSAVVQFFRLTVLLLFLVIANTTLGQLTVCRRSSITEFREEGIYAKTYLGPSMTDVKKIKLFITKKDNYWFVASNFVSFPGAHPTKVASSDDFDLSEVLLNIIASEQSEVNRVSVLVEEIKNFVQIRFTEAFLQSEFYHPDQFYHNWKLEVDCGGSVRALAFTEVQKLALLECYKFLYNYFANCESCRNFFDLHQTPFNRKDIHIVNTAIDLETKSFIESKFGTEFSHGFSSKDEFIKQIAGTNKQVIGVLSHVNRSSHSLEIISESGERFAITYKELEQLGVQYGKVILLLGCYSAEIESGASGALEELNSLVIAKNLLKALEAKNYRDFFALMAGEKYKFLIGDAQAAELSAKASLYKMHDKGFLSMFCSSQLVPTRIFDQKGEILYLKK